MSESGLRGGSPRRQKWRQRKGVFRPYSSNCHTLTAAQAVMQSSGEGL